MRDCTSNDERNGTQSAKVLFQAMGRGKRGYDTIAGQEGQATVDTGPFD